MKIFWKIFTDANSINSTEKVLKWFVEKLGVEFTSKVIEKYHKGGHTCSFETHLELDDWPKAVLNTIELAQKMGRSYTINNSIICDLDLWSNESSISGVTNIQVSVTKNA
jgi:hypothetical protein